VGFVTFSAAPIVCQLAAARLHAGDLSVFTYALHLRNVPHVLLTTVFGTVFLATWARTSAQGQSFLQLVQRDLPKAVLLAAIGSACAIILAPLLLQHLFPSLADSPELLEDLSFLFTLLMLSLPIDLGAYLTTHCQLLLGLHWSYLSAAICRLVCLVVLASLLGVYFGLRGIGVAVVISNLTFAFMVLLSVYLHARHSRQASHSRTTQPLPSHRGLHPEGRA
jgi:peptidoglycan biosynthesis protein MviN/MurJ (putative lipid II flippase)